MIGPISIWPFVGVRYLAPRAISYLVKERFELLGAYNGLTTLYTAFTKGFLKKFSHLEPHSK